MSKNENILNDKLKLVETQLEDLVKGNNLLYVEDSIGEYDAGILKANINIVMQVLKSEDIIKSEDIGKLKFVLEPQDIQELESVLKSQGYMKSQKFLKLYDVWPKEECIKKVLKGFEGWYDTTEKKMKKKEEKGSSIFRIIKYSIKAMESYVLRDKKAFEENREKLNKEMKVSSDSKSAISGLESLKVQFQSMEQDLKQPEQKIIWRIDGSKQHETIDIRTGNNKEKNSQSEQFVHGKVDNTFGKLGSVSRLSIEDLHTEYDDKQHEIFGSEKPSKGEISTQSTKTNKIKPPKDDIFGVIKPYDSDDMLTPENLLKAAESVKPDVLGTNKSSEENMQFAGINRKVRIIKPVPTPHASNSGSDMKR